LGHGYNDIADLLAGFDVLERIGDFSQWVGAIDDRAQVPGLEQTLDELGVGLSGTRV